MVRSTGKAPGQVLGFRRMLAGAAAVFILLVSGLWVLEIHTYLREVRWSVWPWARVQSSQPHQKNCAYVGGHRDPNFAKDEFCLTREEISVIITEILLVTQRAFNRHNVSFFLESGTLLGSYREKGFITYDKDADIGISDEGLLYIQQNRIDVPDEYFLAVWNSSLYPGPSRDERLPARIIHKETGLYADVFAFLPWTNTTSGEEFVGPLPSGCFGGCVRCPEQPDGRKHFQIPKSWVYPLVDCPFNGYTFKCPRESTKYLAYMYGDNFMNPDNS